MDLVVVLAALSQAVGIAKTVREIDQSFDQAEHKIRMAEILGALADAKIALVDANTEVVARKEEIKQLAEALKFKFELVEKHNRHYRKHPETGNPFGKPFCPVCMQKLGLFIGIENVVVNDRIGSQGHCPHCGGKFERVTEYLGPCD